MAYSSRKGRLDLARPVSDHPLNAGLVGWWLVLPHLYGGQRLWDLRNYAHGALVNGPTWQPASRPGGYGSLSLDGTDDKVVVSSLLGMAKPATICMWHYAVSSGTSTALAANASTSVWKLEQYNNTGQYGLTVPSVADYNFGVSFTLGAWAHVTLAIAASSAAFFVNGQLSYTLAQNVAAPVGYFGAGEGGTRDFFNGYLDDIRVYSRALSAGEVAALYRDSRLGHPDTLRWLPDRTWSLPEQQGGAVAESPRLLSLLGVGC